MTAQGPLVYSVVDVTNTSLFTGFDNTPCDGDGTFLWPSSALSAPQGSIISVSLLTESPALSAATSSCNSERCIYRCVSSYGPILSSGDPSYHCAQGCALVPSDGGPFEPADLNNFCNAGEIQRHSTCLDTCDTITSESGRNACRYGCQSWLVRACKLSDVRRCWSCPHYKLAVYACSGVSTVTHSSFSLPQSCAMAFASRRHK